MGTLDDSDVEKIVEAYKKTRTWKGFYDPKKAKSAFWGMFLTAYLGIAFFGVGWFVTWEQMEDLLQENEDLVLQSDSQQKDFNKLRAALLDNADCSSLSAVYQGLHNGNLPYTANLIKDEIQFRC